LFRSEWHVCLRFVQQEPACHVRPRSPLLRRQRNQARFLDPTAAANPEHRAELERRANRPAPGRPLWKKTATGKQPYAVALADWGLMALAGFWENWHSPAGEWLGSFAIVTTKPNELCAELHDRMPVVLAPEVWPVWLGEEPADPRQLKSPSLAVSIGGHDLLAGERARRQRQGQRSVADRTDCFAMSQQRCGCGGR
jgi:SOS response associated peptidase (SRAP)